MLIQYEQADESLDKLNASSEDQFYWDGWTICRFKPSSVAIYDKHGKFNASLGWGFETRYDLNSNGTWEVHLGN